MTNQMQQPESVCLPVTKGTDDEILAVLWRLAYGSLPGRYTDAVYAAIRHILEGGRAVQLAGERFVVVEPELTLEQDVFGCEKGRECTEVSGDQWQQCEALIAARLAAGSGVEQVEPVADHTTD